MKKRILLMMIMLLFPSYALASNYINYDCDEETSECLVTGYSDDLVSAVDIRIKNTNIESFTIDESWQGSFENNELLIYTDVNKTGVFNIGTIKLNVDNSKVMNIENEYSSFFNDNFEEIIIEGKKMSTKRKLNKKKKIKTQNTI